jgi:hypothetical protein
MNLSLVTPSALSQALSEFHGHGGIKAGDRVVAIKQPPTATLPSRFTAGEVRARLTLARQKRYRVERD